MRSKQQFRISRCCACVALGFLPLLATGCSKSKNAASTSSAGLTQSGTAGTKAGKPWALHVKDQPGTVFHVEYADKTVVIDSQTVAQTLRGFSADHDIFLFADSPSLRQKLQPGSIVLLSGLDLRKVDALAVDGQNLIVGTEPAALREALKNAQMQWNVPVDFKDIYDQVADRRLPKNQPSGFAPLDSLAEWFDAYEPKVYASTPGVLEGEQEWEDTDFATWKLKYHHIFNPDHTLDINIELHREAPGMNAEFDAKAHLSRFIQTTSILMADGQFKAASFQNSGLHGTVDFNWMVETSDAKTSMNEMRVKLPGKLSIPLDFTGLPMSLQVSEALLFHPAFTTKGEVAKGGFKVNYSGDEGFKLAESEVEPEGHAEGDSAIDQTFAFSPLAAYGVVVTMAVPRIELRMGTEEIFEALEIPQLVYLRAGQLLQNSPIAGSWLPKPGNPLSTEAAGYFQVVISTTAAHSGMQSLVPCQQFTMNVRGQVGVDSKVLGVDMNTPAKDIFAKDIIQRKPDSKICGGDK